MHLKGRSKQTVLTSENLSRMALPEIQELPMGTKRPLKVIFIGMGASGINFAYQLQRKTTNIQLVIYEKNVRHSKLYLAQPSAYWPVGTCRRNMVRE